MLFLIFLIGTLVSFFSFGDSSSAPDLVAVIFRHGQRNAEGTFLKDLHKNFPWKGGYGAVTPLGIVQMYQLGEKIRSMYPDFKFKSYSQEDMLIRSSTKDRTIVSGQAFMAGFLPPSSNHSFLPIHWQPTGLISVSKVEDNFINFQWICPKYQKELENLITTPPQNIRVFLEKYPNLFEDIKKATGFEAKNILYAWWIYNVFKSQEEAGLPLTKDIREIYESMKPFPFLGFRLLTHNDYMKRVKGGVLLADIITQFKLTLSGSSKREFFAYSAHDLTIVHLMAVLGIEFNSLPDYGAAIILQLSRDKKELKILYANSVNEKFNQIQIPFCKIDLCTLNEFELNYANMMVNGTDEYKKLCEIN